MSSRASSGNVLRWVILVTVLIAVPLAGSAYVTNLLIIIALYATAAIGLSLLTGYAGQISIGHAALYGLGAYGSALLALRLSLAPWLAIPAAAAGVAALAWALGRGIFRLRGHHLAVATLGLGIIAQVGFVEMRAITGGPDGLSGVPPLRIFGWSLDSDLRFYPLAWASCLGALWTATRLMDSPLGVSMRAMGQSERGAAALGTDVAALKTGILVVSAVFAAAAGGLYVHYIGFVSPQPFGVGFSIRLIVMIAVGGFASVWGAMLGAAFVAVVGQVLAPLGRFDVIVYGLILILLMIVRPQDLWRRLVAVRSARP